MTELLLKVTLILALSLCAQGLLRRATAALRHLVCAVALLAVGLMPLSLVWRPQLPALQFPLTTFSAVARASTSSPTAPSMSSLVLTLWGIGAFLVLARLAIGYWRVAQTRRTATPLPMTSGFPVYEADVPVPLAVGLARPAILLPATAAQWPHEHRVATLRHEAAHINRKDLWTNLIAHLVTAIYWFHPLAWAVARRLREEQELACDDAAVVAGTSPELYAEALVAVARFSRPPAITVMIGCPMITRTSLKNRIARLVDTGLSRTPSTKSLWRAAALTALMAGAVAMVTATPQAAPPAEPEGEKVYRVGQDVTAPSVLLRSDPEYTEEARAAKIAGTVLLSIVVGKDGKAHHINVLKGLEGGLDIKAVEAVQRWRFNPSRRNGEPVDVRAQIEINFRVE